VSTRRGHRESGYTLSEVCIAVVILAVAVTAAVGSLASAIFVSRQHRSVVTSDAVVRRYAEQLELANYIDCGTGPAYIAANAPAPALPANFTMTVTVTYADTNNPANFGATCPSNPDNGAQLMRIVAQGPSGIGSQSLQVVKRKP